MKNSSLRTAPLILVGIFTLLAGTWTPLLAHGEGRTLQRGHVLVSTCYLSIWTAPSILRTGEVHIETSVFNQDGSPAQAALVQVALTPLQGQAPLAAVPALPVAGMAGSLRTAAFNVQQPGKYRVALLVTDEAGSGTVAFEVEITRIARWVHLLIYSQLLASVLVGIWLVQKGLMVWFGKTQPRASTPA